MYLSQLLGRPVRDSSEVSVGRLRDILVPSTPGIYAPLKFLVVRRRGGAERYLPYEYVATLSRADLTLTHLSRTIPGDYPAGDWVRLAKDVLDQQIVDVEGARIVRVNDLKLGPVDNAMSVIGIDVSLKGMLRRLGLGRFDFLNLFKVNLIDWRKAHLVKRKTAGGAVQLDSLAAQLTKLHPADLANIIEDLTIKQGGRLIGSLDTEAAAHAVEEMNPEIKKMIIHYLGPERSARILERMSLDEAVDLLKTLPRAEAAAFLSYLQQGKTKKLEKLLPYPNDTAGGMMSIEYVSARPDWSVAKTLEEVRQVSPHLRSLLYVYITEESGKFRGAVSLRRLLTAAPTARLKDIVKKLPRHSVLSVKQKIDEIVKVMTRYNLYSAAVLDTEGRLAGVLSIDDVMRRLVPHA
ncbi:MAG: magnesium transporter [Candidatus Magasanikbacteria bacterium]|nr:magnesium transporter [Candidatus Magasanikbacteria bacterium]